MTDLATYFYEMKVRNHEFSKETCKEGEHDYSEHRLKGFPGHDYYVYYCRKCGRDKPNEEYISKTQQKRLGKGWRQVVEQQKNQEESSYESTS
jgi:hypothetical protein